MKTRIVLNGENGSRVIGIGEIARWESYGRSDLRSLDAFLEAHTGKTRFLMLSYELRHQWYGNESFQERFPVVRVWVPETEYTWQDNHLLYKDGVRSVENDTLAEACLATNFPSETMKVDWKPTQSRTDYLNQLLELKEQIRLGNLYEVNYCQEFFAEQVDWETIVPVCNALNAVSRAPFSVLYEAEDWMVAGASPERFLRKEGDKLISQPIKGTAARGKNEVEDEVLRAKLAASHKDRTENVMIVDLVRNDLSRVAKRDSVQVDELFGIHTFPTVHQMISTISCTLRPEVTFTDILEATFPMGSMTGAPKVASMDLAEKHERFTRGLYSGSVGYMSPEGDFDLNVMIRSLVYDRAGKRVSCGVGGAITILSDPEDEYRECQVKVGRLLESVGTCRW